MSLDYDAELSRYQDVLRRAWGIRPEDRILDVGCGRGRTTREAARAARAGSALGVDVSAAAVERARELADGLANVAFEVADAQTHAFAAGSFDLVISRFGTMFFADPGAAFANIGRALRPGGRLAMAVWQAAGRNEWEVTIRDALGGPEAEEGPDAFSLAEPATVREILGAAGFSGVELAEIAEPVYYGPDPDAALEWVRGFASVRAAPDRVLERLRDAFAARASGAGVWFDARAWLVTARR